MEKKWHMQLKHRLNQGLLALMVLSVVIIATQCVEEYNPDIAGKDNLLVVNGSIIRGDEQQTILVSRSTSVNNPAFIAVGGCNVVVTDDVITPCSVTSTVVISVATSIKEFENVYEINIYPNPVNNTFTITSGINVKNAAIKIYNINGKIVYTGIFNGNKNNYNINQLPKGLYYFEMNNDTQLIYREMISKN